MPDTVPVHLVTRAGGCQVRGHTQTLRGAEVDEVRRGEEAGARGPPRKPLVGAAAGAGAVLGWGPAGRGRGPRWVFRGDTGTRKAGQGAHLIC